MGKTRTTGNLVSENILSVDIANDRVGVGTSNPSQKFEVVGGEIKAGRVDSNQEGGQLSFGRASDNNTGWYIDVYGSTSTPDLRIVDVSNAAVRATVSAGGSFGIGVSPEAILHVQNSTATRQDGGLARFLAPNLNAGADNSVSFGKQFNNATSQWQSALLGYSYDGVNSGSSNSYIYLNVAGRSNTFVVHTNENVGIGVTIPQQRLDVISGGNIAIGGKIVTKGTGSILQVVHTEYTTTTTVSCASMTDISGFSASITPTSTSNKVLVMVHFTGVLECDGRLALKVGGSVVKDNLVGSDRINGSVNVNDVGTYCATYLHSPASTSSLTYQISVQCLGCSNSAYLNYSSSGSDNNGRSGITLMEVVA